MPNLPSSYMSPSDQPLPGYGTGFPMYMPMPSGASSSMGSFGDGDGSSGGGPGVGGAVGAGVAGIGSFLTSLFTLKNQNAQAQKQRDLQQNIANQSTQANSDANTQSVANQEATRDPFRDAMFQGADLARLDHGANASYTPTKMAPTGPYAKYVPQTSGGYSYQKSPDVIAAINALKQSVMSGNGAPSMTNPGNYGKTGALDLAGVAAGTKDPHSTSSFATGAPAAGSSITGPAANAIRQAYMDNFGRQPTDADILRYTDNGRITMNDPRLSQAVANIAAEPEARAYKAKQQGGAPAAAGWGGGYGQ